MLNDCSFIGNLGNDPEVRASKDGKSFTNFSIAINKQGADREEKPLWVNVTAFGKSGEFVGKYLKKGSQVFVQGRIEVQEYEGKDGKNHVSVKLLSNNVLSLGKKDSDNSNGATAVKTVSTSAVAVEDIPF